MNINITWTNLESNPETFEYIHKKLEGIDKYFPRPILQIDCEVERDTHHQTGNVFRFEANIDIPGKLLRAEQRGGTIFECIDFVKDELIRQLRKEKEIAGDKHKREMLESKETLHTSPFADEKRSTEYLKDQPKYDEDGNVIS